MSQDTENTILKGQTLREITLEMSSALTPLYGNRESRTMSDMAIEHIMGYTPVDRVLKANEAVSDFRRSQLSSILNSLLSQEPLQYILGEAHFMGLKFTVNPSVLIPRPETEELVDIIIKENQRNDLRVLDIGTGSGCIAISLARGLKFAIIDAIDISRNALATAKTNADRLRVNVRFTQSDALELKPEPLPTYDIIVSNPPYIAQSEKKLMSPNVIDHEPHQALFVSDSDPLIFYTAIIRYATTALKPGGKIYLEINPLFVSQLENITRNIFPNGYISIIRDMQGKQRFAIITTDGAKYKNNIN